MTKIIREEEGKRLLQLARDAIKRAMGDEPSPRLDLARYPAGLREFGASFVTLKIDGVLRGCVGSIEATDPLVKDVRDRAIAAAFHDPRFPPLTPEELSRVVISVSCLTKPERLEYSTPGKLASLIRPGVDGLILRYHFRRATFLPQVWDQLPAPGLFLGRLCQKMGLPPDTWKKEIMEAEVYQAIKFSETDKPRAN